MDGRNRWMRRFEAPPIKVVEFRWRPFTLKLIGLDVRDWARFLRYLLRKDKDT